MGDRAIIVFHSGEEISPAVYLHYHGDAVEELLRGAKDRLRADDAEYSAARFCGHCHDKIGGNTGLGLFNAPATLAECKEKDFSQGDAGVFLVDVATGHVTAYNGYGFGGGDDDDEMNIPDRMETDLGELPR
jgi:hypothetical protein